MKIKHTLLIAFCALGGHSHFQHDKQWLQHHAEQCGCAEGDVRNN